MNIDWNVHHDDKYNTKIILKEYQTNNDNNRMMSTITKLAMTKLIVAPL